MEYTEHKLTLDVHKTVSTTSVSLKKGDTAHRLLITLSEGGYPYHIGEDCTAAFSALKPDGAAIFNDCRIEGDTVIYDMTEQTTAETGMVSCEIQIYGANGDLLTSASFLLFVEEGVNNRNAVVSSDEFTKLTAMIRDARIAIHLADSASKRATKAAAACMVIGIAKGEVIRLDDAIDAPFVGMRIFGKTTQNGIPTPVNPATLVSVGAIGRIKLTSNEQTVTIPTTSGLPGIPVASGGNYIDSNGQQWICDEIDFSRGVYVQRIGKIDLGTLSWRGSNEGVFFSTGRTLPVEGDRILDTNLMCSIYSPDKTAQDWQYVSNNCVLLRKDTDVLGFYSVCVKDERFNTASDFKNAVLGVDLHYILPVLVETTLPEEDLAAYDAMHTYRDNTTILNDASAYMEVEYPIDAKKYIDKMISTGIHEATLE